MATPTIRVCLDSEQLDEAIEKANRLVMLLREASDLIDSLSHNPMDNIRFVGSTEALGRELCDYMTYKGPLKGFPPTKDDTEPEAPAK